MCEPANYLDETPGHGTRAHYRKGCRCRGCRAANARYENKRRMSGSSLVGSESVKDHLSWLTSSGMSTRSVARAAGVSTALVYRLLGSPSRRPATRVKLTTAQAILGVTPQDRRGSDLVDATGARRRLRALSCLGWSTRALSQELGWVEWQTRELLASDRARVQARKDKKVREVYARLHRLPGPDTRSARSAWRKGWVEPVRWRGVNIDDPKEIPIQC